MSEHIEYFEKVILGCNRSILNARGHKNEAQEVEDIIRKRKHYEAAVTALKMMEDDGR